MCKSRVYWLLFVHSPLLAFVFIPFIYFSLFSHELIWWQHSFGIQYSFVACVQCADKVCRSHMAHLTSRKIRGFSKQMKMIAEWKEIFSLLITYCLQNNFNCYKLIEIKYYSWCQLGSFLESSKLNWKQLSCHFVLLIKMTLFVFDDTIDFTSKKPLFLYFIGLIRIFINCAIE